MYTQTHVLMGAALFGGKVPKRAWLGAPGGALPDIPMLLIVAGLKLTAIPDPLIHGYLYAQDWWQVTNGITHNFWIWAGVFLVAFFLRERLAATAETIDRCSLVLVFSASGVMHVLIDFLTHREDAHMSFWPVTRWQFVSPVSFRDPAHFGQPFGLFEAVLGLGLATLLIRRFADRWAHLALVITMLLYVTVTVCMFLL